MPERQHTLKEPVRFEGVGLHTACASCVVVRPADENTGIVFVRTDLPDRPAIKVCLEHVWMEDALPRCSSLRRGAVWVHTVEHLLAALSGCGVDNAIVEINAAELPGLDGSAKPFAEAFVSVGFRQQDAERRWIDLARPLVVSGNGCAITAVPSSGMEVHYTLDYNHPFLHGQVFSARIDQTVFLDEISPARTFCLESEAQQLKAMGLGQGADYDNTLVIGDTGIVRNQLRFDNECARHKVLDILGDFYLLGRPVRAKVFAVRSGHGLNRAMVQKIHRQMPDEPSSCGRPQSVVTDGDAVLDIHGIMGILPHRYPFLFIDRIVELDPGRRAVALKTVAVDEPYFEGHFPQRPLMPGVVMIEALAQTGGVAVLTDPGRCDELALFMAVEEAKFRRTVQPGDVLRLEACVERMRARIVALNGWVTTLHGDRVCEAKLTFSFVPKSFLQTSETEAETVAPV